MGPAYTTTSYRKRKVKITKARMHELEQAWLAHNRHCKQNNNRDLMYDKFEDYVDYCYGRVKVSKKFTPIKSKRSYFAERDAEHKKKYPSLMEQQMKDGTFMQNGGKGTAREKLKYTGDLIVGIATMHKSNAVPVMRDTTQAIDIAKMRR